MPRMKTPIIVLHPSSGLMAEALEPVTNLAQVMTNLEVYNETLNKLRLQPGTVQDDMLQTLTRAQAVFAQPIGDDYRLGLVKFIGFENMDPLYYSEHRLSRQIMDTPVAEKAVFELNRDNTPVAHDHPAYLAWVRLCNRFGKVPNRKCKVYLLEARAGAGVPPSQSAAASPAKGFSIVSHGAQASGSTPALETATIDLIVQWSASLSPDGRDALLNRLAEGTKPA